MCDKAYWQQVDLQNELGWALRHVERAQEALLDHRFADAYGELLDAQRGMLKVLDAMRDVTGLPVG